MNACILVVDDDPEIVGAIRYADRWKIGDVIITGRGGGSMEDLWRLWIWPWTRRCG